MLLDRLRYLPGNEVTGNQTIMMRAIVGDNASTNAVVHLHVMGETAISATEETGGFAGLLVLLTSLLIILLLGLVVSVLMLKGHFSEVRTRLGLSLPAELLYEDGLEEDSEAHSAEPRNG
jgi:hypothetical protein